VGARATAGISCPSRKVPPLPPYGDSEGARGAGCGAMLLASGSSFHFGFIISVPAHVRARSGELIKCF